MEALIAVDTALLIAVFSSRSGHSLVWKAALTVSQRVSETFTNKTG
jgi:hypothetical protein